jgi:hypothetical protein
LDSGFGGNSLATLPGVHWKVFHLFSPTSQVGFTHDLGLWSEHILLSVLPSQSSALFSKNSGNNSGPSLQVFLSCVGFSGGP